MDIDSARKLLNVTGTANVYQIERAAKHKKSQTDSPEQQRQIQTARDELVHKEKMDWGL